MGVTVYVKFGKLGLANLRYWDGIFVNFRWRR